MATKDALDEAHWVWASFDELNARYFKGALQHPQQILRSCFNGWAAATVNKEIAGTSCRLIWIDGTALDETPAITRDSLLHEMIHYELAAAADGDGDQTHGARFMRRADEIGRVLGLLPCELPGFTLEEVRKIAGVWPQVQRQAQHDALKLT